MQMARLLLQAHEKTPAGRIRRGFCMKAQDADFFLRALPNGSRMKNSDLVCCFAFRNCYIYEVSKKRRNRRMKQEQVLALYDAYADSVYRVALGYLRSPHDAEDAAQAVFCKLLERDSTVYPGKERAFLTKLTVNHSKNQLTARKRFLPDAWDELILSAEQEDRMLFRAVLELPEKYRLVVLLHCMEGYSFSKIAGFLHITASAVSMRLHRARKMLDEQRGRD